MAGESGGEWGGGGNSAEEVFGMVVCEVVIGWIGGNDIFGKSQNGVIIKLVR